MACFIAPLTEAAITSTLKVLTRNKKDNIWLNSLPGLEKMLWGGSAMLVVDHIVSGELSAGLVLREVLTTGLAMCAAVTAVWAGAVVLKQAVKARKVKDIQA